MCIRDRANTEAEKVADETTKSVKKIKESVEKSTLGDLDACLLYTSDAADERSSVDLGGRRIIKKKKKR